MLLLNWATTAALGRIVIFVWQRFPERYVPTKYLRDVHACDLCSGTFIYPVMFFIDKQDVVTSMLYGVVTSFLVWVFVKGMKSITEPTTLVIK